MTDIASERRAVARAVKADVEAIFGAPPRGEAPGRSRMRSMAAVSASVEKRPSRAAAIGGSVALALAGVAVGALLTRDPPPSPEPVRAVASAPPPASLEVVLTPQAPVTPLVIEQAPPQPNAAPAPKPKAKSASGDCAVPGGRRCTYSVVLSADSSLRQAYRRAGRAGVSGKELAAYRSKWNRLRRAGAHDPDRVVRGYRAMAADLNRLARDRRA